MPLGSYRAETGMQNIALVLNKSHLTFLLSQSNSLGNLFYLWLVLACYLVGVIIWVEW